MKVHVGTDTQGLVHSILTTDAAQADINQFPDLLHGEERELYGDGAYWREEDRRSFREAGVRYRVNRHWHRSKPLNDYWKPLNQ
jgi:transposase, IS5 family